MERIGQTAIDNEEQLTLGSLFDGIGGWQLAAIRNGVKPVWSSEIEKFPLAVTKFHFPETKQLGDIRNINGAEIEPVDIICAGSPCQNLSIAGNREGLNGKESSLFTEAIRILNEMRQATKGLYPRVFIWENVPGAFTSGSERGADFRAVLESIAETSIPMPKDGRWANAGMVQCPKCEIAWRVLDAQYWGVPQRRKRIFLVADFAESDRCATKVLFVSKGVSGDSEQGDQEGQTTSKNSATGIGNAVCIRMRGGKPGGGKGALLSVDRSLTLAANTNDQTLFQEQQFVDIYNGTITGDVAATVMAESCKTATRQGPTIICNKDAVVLRDRLERCACTCNEKQTVGSLCAHDGRGFNGQDVSNDKLIMDVVRQQYLVRRLTPLECERLQGLPDGYTLIDDKSCSDSARYKAIGNGMSQPCADFVIQGIVRETTQKEERKIENTCSM